MKQIIGYIQSRLKPIYTDEEALAMAWWVAEELTGLSRSQLQFGDKGTTNNRHLQTSDAFLEEIISRLLQYEPIQYIFEHTQWAGLSLKVTPATLIPRPETAELMEMVSKQISDSALRVVDIGTGSGCIAIALKKSHPQCTITGLDISEEALNIARENALQNEVDVTFRKIDIFSDEIEEIGSFDIVVSNPPYVCEREKKDMSANVVNFEPHTALFVDDKNPFIYYKRIASLRIGGRLYLEINEAYPNEVAAVLKEEGYDDITVIHDIYGKPRIISCRLVE